MFVITVFKKIHATWEALRASQSMVLHKCKTMISSLLLSVSLPFTAVNTDMPFFREI